MSDINVGFGKVLRVRWLKANRERKHIFVRRDDSPAALRDRHDRAFHLLESRRDMRLAGADLSEIEYAIKALGYKFEDEPSEDGRYSYWRFR